MAKQIPLSFYFLVCILIINLDMLCNAEEDQRKDYIVYLGSLPKGVYSASYHHLSLLQEVVPSSYLAANCLIRSYKRSFNGFAARLTNQEAQRLVSMTGVVSVFPSTKLQLQTTRSWDFMGFSEQLSKSPKNGSDVVIGVIDDGIWPESESFNDEGFGSLPTKWKGVCKGGMNFTCNKKLIGARYYSTESARDQEGHGTHTASTAAGNVVKDVSFYGLAKGSSRGGFPSSRIAAYRVCNPIIGCESHAILAAFDDAIADGVDIITISIGYSSSHPFETDVIAIGAFHAMEEGILTVHSAGNSGPVTGTIASVAPWKLGVAASSTDRRIVTKLVLGDGKTFVGTSVNSYTLHTTEFPLIHGKDASRCGEYAGRYCLKGCLASNLVNGRIVLCEGPSGTSAAKRAGAVGVIMKTEHSDIASIVPLPAVSLSLKDLHAVISYEGSTGSAKARILESEAIKDDQAPFVASFSSRGPNMIAPDILKPDITAPGIDILAAFSPIASPSDNPEDKRSVKYSIMSGTSMACPHVAGVAAYVKASHPDWSPSAIKSAIMTTAWTMNATRYPEGEFAYGSGHINPVKAIDPGLVYETAKDDYVKFLCSSGYDEAKLRVITGESIHCPTDKGSPRDLNYPSMAAKVSIPTESFNISFHRTVTNVGVAGSTYKAKIFSSSNLEIKVVPEVLSFKSLKETQSFSVMVASKGLSSAAILESASLVWSDGKHSVRSPIVVYSM